MPTPVAAACNQLEEGDEEDSTKNRVEAAAPMAPSTGIRLPAWRFCRSSPSRQVRIIQGSFGAISLEAVQPQSSRSIASERQYLKRQSDRGAAARSDAGLERGRVGRSAREARRPTLSS